MTVKINSLASYLSDRKHSFKIYTLVYFFCLVLNFLNCIVQLYLITNIIGDSIFDFSLMFKDQIQSNHMIFDVFPTNIICDFLKDVKSSSEKGMYV